MIVLIVVEPAHSAMQEVVADELSYFGSAPKPAKCVFGHGQLHYPNEDPIYKIYLSGAENVVPLYKLELPRQELPLDEGYRRNVQPNTSVHYANGSLKIITKSPVTGGLETSIQLKIDSDLTRPELVEAREIVNTPDGTRLVRSLVCSFK